MIDAMVLRGFAARTQETCLTAVGQLAHHHHRSPDLLSDEQVQACLLYLLQERHRARSTVNMTACAMRWFCAAMWRSPCGAVISLDSCRYWPPAMASTSPARLPTLVLAWRVACVLVMLLLSFEPMVIDRPPLPKMPLLWTERDS